MAYIFRGHLGGFICAQCPEALSNVRVRLYRNRPEQNVTLLAVASPEDTSVILTDKQVKEKASSLLAETETNNDGLFIFELGEKQNYHGEAFEVDVYCETMPYQKIGPNPPPPRQFTITTLQPLWRQSETGFLWVWDYCLPARFWSAIRALFGAQVICGHVTIYGTQEPVSHVTVTAFDANWFDDPLGSAVTDGAGIFRIDYTHRPFLATLFSQLTPLLPNASGPDVHFRIQRGVTDLLDEPKSRGRQPDRVDIGSCFCVDLCVEADQIVPIPEQTSHRTR
jgi:hypothetical protein